MKKIVIICALLVSFIDINAQVIHRTTSSNTVSASITTRTVTKQKKVHQEYLRPLGFRQMVELNLGGSNWGVDYIAGYKFNQYFFLGAGLGLEAINHHNGPFYYDPQNGREIRTALCVPLYLNTKVYFTKTRVQPYADLSLGGHFISAKGLMSGYLIDVGPGFSVLINEKLSFYTSAKWGAHSFNRSSRGQERDRYTYGLFQLHIGLEF